MVAVLCDLDAKLSEGEFLGFLRHGRSVLRRMGLPAPLSCLVYNTRRGIHIELGFEPPLPERKALFIEVLLGSDRRRAVHDWVRMEIGQRPRHFLSLAKVRRSGPVHVRTIDGKRCVVARRVLTW